MFSRQLAGLLFLALSGCGRYADFTLPVLTGGTSPKWEWSARSTPVLVPGDWDSGDVLNPSVVRRDGLYYNFYSGFDGKTWHTGLATSADGVAWQKQGRILSPDPRTWEGSYIAANGTALLVNGEFFYWYQAGPKDAPAIALARSSDGRAWHRSAAAVVPHGPCGSWDERAAADPYVIRLTDGYFYMYYLGQDRALRQRMAWRARAMASSGRNCARVQCSSWERRARSTQRVSGEPAVWVSGGYYWMLYTGRDPRRRTAHGPRPVARWRELGTHAARYLRASGLGQQSRLRSDGRV